MSTQIPILFLEAPTIRMDFAGTDPSTGQNLRMNLGPVDTNLSKPTQSILAAALLRDLPDFGYEPIFGFFDGKSLPIEHLGKSLAELSALGYVTYRRTIPYAGGKIEVYRLGRGLDTISDRLCDFPVLAATSNFTFESDLVLEAIRLYKRTNPRGKVIIGGRDATYRPEHYLRAGADAVVRGEGEGVAAQLVVDLVENKRTTIAGVCYGRNGMVVGKDSPVLRSPISRLPLPHFFRSSEILRPDLPGDQLQYYVESQDGPLLAGARPPVYHFTTSRGCGFGCTHCTTAGMRHDCMEPAHADQLLRYLRDNGVNTLISAEDAFMERVKTLGRERGREVIIAIMQMIRDYGFAIEWANGLNFHMFEDEKGEVDLELLDAVFASTFLDDQWIGTYRMLTPVERPSGDKRLKKLLPGNIQAEIIREIVKRHRIPSQGLTWIMRPEDTLEHIEAGKQGIIRFQEIIRAEGHGVSSSRLGLFCLMPHPGSKDARLERLVKFPIADYPELRHYFLPVLDGRELGGMGYADQFWTRLRILRELDPDTYTTWMSQGGYRR